MTKSKRNNERRETTVREFRTITSGSDKKKVGYNLGIDESTADFNKILESNELAMKKKLAAALEIKKMEATGMFSPESIRLEKIKLGILQEGSTTPGSTSTNVNDVIITQIANEQDPQIRLQLTQTLASLDMMKQPGNQSSALATLQNTMNKGTAAPKSTFESQMTEMMMKKFLEEPKSELENLSKLKTLMDGVQSLMPQSNPLEEMKNNLKLFQDMGIAVSPGNSIEEKRLDLEKVRMEKELSIEERKIDADAERTKSLASIGGDVLASVVGAFGDQKKTTGPPPPGPSQEYVEDSLEAKCVNNNCGNPILITNSNTSRDVFCTKCNQKYQYKSDEKKLYMTQKAI